MAHSATEIPLNQEPTGLAGMSLPPVSLAAFRAAAPAAALASVDDRVADVVDRFEADPSCVAILVMDGLRFVNSISRDALAAHFTKPFFRELYHDKPLSRLLPHWGIPALQLPEGTLVVDAISTALHRPAQFRYEPLVVVAADGARFVLDLHGVLIEECRILTTTLRELERQREAVASAEREREQLNQRLVTASREAGRAEIATGVLHDVGNVLNSVNVSAALIAKTLQQSKLPKLQRAVRMIVEKNDDLVRFLMDDERGRQIPAYLNSVTEVLSAEHSELIAETTELARSLEHIKQVVQMQQTHAKLATLIEPADPSQLIEEALRVNLTSLERHQIRIERNIDGGNPVTIDKHRTLGILINLISNAKNALRSKESGDRCIAIRVERVPSLQPGMIRFIVRDNGTGIPAENLTRIFAHGFTTRSEGHGFGLHSAANAAREMQGSLRAASPGLDRGATFTLEIPLRQMNDAVCDQRVKVPA